MEKSIIFLNRNDLQQSLHCFNQLLSAAHSFTTALNDLSRATSSFAKALEDCARLKGSQSNQNIPKQQQNQQQEQQSPFDPAQRLLAASGLHFISSNLLQLLSTTIKDSFQSPLSKLYDSYSQQLTKQHFNYQSIVSLRTKAIRETELRNLTQPCPSSSISLARRSPRDLDSFRRGLKDLQDQVEQLESLKESYYLQLAIGERDIWTRVADNISLVVKSQVEVYDRIASKPTSDPTLEWMTTINPDPFDAYQPLSTLNSSNSETPEIYSILDPLSHLLQSRSPSRVRKSLDLSQSLGSLGHPFDHQRLGSIKSSSSSDDRRSQLDSTSLWAAHSVPTTQQSQQTQPEHLDKKVKLDTTSGFDSLHHHASDSSSSEQLIHSPHHPVDQKKSLETISIPSSELNKGSQPTSTLASLPSAQSSLTVTSPPSASSSPKPQVAPNPAVNDHEKVNVSNALVTDSDHSNQPVINSILEDQRFDHQTDESYRLNNRNNKYHRIDNLDQPIDEPLSTSHHHHKSLSPFTRKVTDSSLEVINQLISFSKNNRDHSDLHNQAKIDLISSPSFLGVPNPNSTSLNSNFSPSHTTYSHRNSVLSDDHDNLLREQPPTGIDLSDSDL